MYLVCEARVHPAPLLQVRGQDIQGRRVAALHLDNGVGDGVEDEVVRGLKKEAGWPRKRLGFRQVFDI